VLDGFEGKEERRARAPVVCAAAADFEKRAVRAGDIPLHHPRVAASPDDVTWSKPFRR